MFTLLLNCMVNKWNGWYLFQRPIISPDKREGVSALRLYTTSAVWHPQSTSCLDVKYFFLMKDCSSLLIWSTYKFVLISFYLPLTRIACSLHWCVVIQYLAIQRKKFRPKSRSLHFDKEQCCSCSKEMKIIDQVQWEDSEEPGVFLSLRNGDICQLPLSKVRWQQLPLTVPDNDW